MAEFAEFAFGILVGLGFVAWLALSSMALVFLARQMWKMLGAARKALCKKRPAEKLYACECDLAMRKWSHCSCRVQGNFRGL